MSKPTGGRVLAVAACAAVMLVASCGGSGSGRVAAEIADLGFAEPAIAEAVVAGRVTVTVTSDAGPDDPTAANGVARVVWEAHPTRVDRVVVSAPGSSATFERARLQDMFGPRDAALDAVVPTPSVDTSDPVPTWLFPLVATLVVIGVVVVAARRVGRRDGVGGMASTANGLVFAGSRATGLVAEGADAVDGSPPAVDAVFSVEDVLDVLAVLAEGGIADGSVLLAGRWAVRAWSGEGPDALPLLDLLVDRSSVAVAVRELASVGFAAEWRRRVGGDRHMVVRDRSGRVVRISPMQVVDDDGEASGGDCVRVPRARVGFGRLDGVEVPCVAPQASPVA